MKNLESPTGLRTAWAARRKELTPKTIRMSREEMVKVGSLSEGGLLPLVVESNLVGVDLAEWAANSGDFISRSLLKHGGLLLRGFGLKDQEDFDRFLSAIELPRMQYMEGATPRTELRERVYTSTEYPADQTIALHNELTYVVTWPMKIFFFCVIPAASGGETPIADVRRVYNRINPKIRERFHEKGWMLVRNFGEHLSLPWQTSFRVSTREEMEDYCRRARVECIWKGNGDLETRQVRPAVRQHPKTGEWVWFNHVAFWHISSLDPEVRKIFLSEFNLNDLPYNTYYGDGSPIDDEVVDEIREAYRQETVAFPWQEGDVLMMDNMLVAHGRNTFSGTRKILVAMGEPGTDSN